MTWEVEVIPSVAFGVAASKRAGLCGWTALAAMGSGRGLRPHLLLHSRVSSCASWYWYAVEAAVGAVTALALMRGEDHARPCDGLVRHASDRDRTKNLRCYGHHFPRAPGSTGFRSTRGNLSESLSETRTETSDDLYCSKGFRRANCDGADYIAPRVLRPRRKVVRFSF
jgi:hypothetical protein